MVTLAHILCYPQKSLIMTRTTKYSKLDQLPHGQQTIVAIATYTGYNQEDSIIINESAVQRGLFNSIAFKTYKDKEQRHKTAVNLNGNEKFGRPDPILTKDMKPGSYDYLDETGFARVGSQIKGGDIIIGKYIELRPEEKAKTGKEYRDISKDIKHNEDGIVDKVINGKTGILNYNAEGEAIGKIRVSKLRIPEIGDKFASRHAQKGTCGMLYRQEDMPFTDSGIVPDLIINPHAIPSRMKIGQLLETLIGKVAAIKGQIMDATPFMHFNQENIENMLESFGFSKYCDEVLYNGQTGQQLKVPIFIGPTYYQRLKHMVMDKVHSRETGPVQLLTRQPQEGRARDGGLRFGEMERDCIIAHGASQFLKERFMDSSDLFRVFISKKDQVMIIANPERDLFMYKDKELTREEVVEIQLPYAMKLLLHEMNSMGIDTRLITD